MARGIRYLFQPSSDGIAIQQLWEQFRAEAIAGYRLYSKEVESGLSEGESRRKGFWRVARGRLGDDDEAFTSRRCSSHS